MTDSKRPEVETTGSTGSKSRRVTVTRDDLSWAASEGLIREAQVDALWNGLSAKLGNQSGFNWVNIASYGGAIVILIAMAAIMAIFAGNEQGVFAISSIYMAGFGLAGWFVARDKRNTVQGGLLMTLAVAMTPVVGISWMAMNGGVDLNTSQQLIVEFATILAGVLALQLVRFSFITAPIYAAMWFMAMTITDTLAPGLGWAGQNHLYVTMVMGAAVTGIAFMVEKSNLSKEQDYSFWGYFFGLLMLWGAWTFLCFDFLGGQAPLATALFYFVTAVAMMVASVVLSRKIFLVYGAGGAIWSLLYITWDIFGNSTAYPFVLLAMGIGVIVLAIQYRKRGHILENAIAGLIKKDGK